MPMVSACSFDSYLRTKIGKQSCSHRVTHTIKDTMNYRIGFSLFGIIALSSVLGCASSQLQSQVDQLQKTEAAQKREINDLNGKLATVSAEHATGNLVMAGKEGIDAASSAWSVASAQVSDSYKSVSDAAKKCYHASVVNISKSASFDDYMGAAMHCWNAVTSNDDIK